MEIGLFRLANQSVKMSGVTKLPPKKAHNDDDDDDNPKSGSCTCIRRTSRILLLLMATALTIYVCILSSRRYFMYWVQTTIERTDVHVSEIAFPAITICPTHLSRSSFNGSNKQRRELSRQHKLFNLMQDIQWGTIAANRVTDEDFEQFESYYNSSLLDMNYLIDPNFKCEDLFQQCMWRRREIDCCSIFQRFGLGITCFSFNLMTVNTPKEGWPWSVAGAGFSSGLNVKLNRNVGEHRVESVGVIVLEPDQYLGTSVTCTSDDRIVIPLQPLRFTAEPAVKARPVEMRYCYFTEELKLNGRSRSECIHGCHVNYMTKMCNCQFELPMAKYNEQNESIRRCSFKDLACFRHHKVSIFSMSNIIEESTDYIFNTTDCKCYPNCNHIQYHSSIYTDRLGSTKSSTNSVEIDVYFQEETLFSYRSTLYITLVDLMVSYGGIAGLFLGVSVIGGINALLDRIACCCT